MGSTVNRSRSGDIAELQAVAWLLDQEYEVFRNVGCTGPIDVVAYKDGKIILFDIKKATMDDARGSFRASRLTEEQIKGDIKRLIVFPGYMFAIDGGIDGGSGCSSSAYLAELHEGAQKTGHG